MATVNINGTVFILDTNQERPGYYTTYGIQRAQAAMLEAGVTSAPIIDAFGEPTGEDLPDELEPKALALAEVLGVSPLGCLYDGAGFGDVWSSDEEPGEYRVLDESEREQAADEALESYIDECIIEQAKAEARDNAALASLIRTLSDHFDRASWKQLALDSDGYGHTLASYDGEEREACIDGTWYYVYRVD